MADLGVALGLYHLSPSGFDRVLELPSYSPGLVLNRQSWCSRILGPTPTSAAGSLCQPMEMMCPAKGGKGLSSRAGGVGKVSAYIHGGCLK